MAASSHFSLVVLLSLSTLLFPQTLAQVPAPAAGGPPDLNATLAKTNQYNTFLRLLNETQVIVQLKNQLNSTNNGFSVLAPTDNAFNNLQAGALNSLNPQEKSQLVLYHIIPQFLTLTNLLTVSNPVNTQATGKYGVWGLNFTGQNNQVNVSSGVVVTQIYNPLRQERPLAVYQVDKVLLPEELFGTKSESPAATPEPGKKGSGGSNSTKSNDTGADSPSGNSGSSNDAVPGRSVGLGFVLGLGWMAFFFS